jgi:NhaP-type Na+/H+ and K+/H+ antiporter
VRRPDEERHHGTTHYRVVLYSLLRSALVTMLLVVLYYLVPLERALDVLAVGSQVLASRLRVPSLLVLSSVGFAAGALTGGINPDQLFGAAFPAPVSLAVAVILYDAG